MPDTAARPPDIADVRVRAFTPDDLTEVLELYEDRDFLYRTDRPDLLGQSRIGALVGAADVCCRVGGRLAGLFAADPLPAGYPGHHQVHMRFAGWLSDDLAAGVCRRLIAGLADRMQVRRLTHLVPGFDGRGLALAAAVGFRDEGALDGMVNARGRRWPLHYLALRVPSYPLAFGVPS